MDKKADQHENDCNSNDCQNNTVNVRRNQITPDEIEHLEILKNISYESIWGLIEYCPVITLKPGEKLLSEGQVNNEMYMIVEGELDIFLQESASEPVASLTSGQTVGELSVIDRSPTSASVIASTQTRLLVVDQVTFWRMVAVSHEFSKNMLLQLSQRMRATNYTIAENMRLRKILEHEVMVDALTGMHNRRWLDKNLPRLMRRSTHNGEPLCLIMFDVDHFKKFNDNYGHSAGDIVLTTLGEVITESLRASDFGSRYGGEEFVCVLPGSKLGDGIATAERLRKMIETKEVEDRAGGTLPRVTISLGVTEYVNNEPVNDFVNRADRALYLAKEKGRNCVITC